MFYPDRQKEVWEVRQTHPDLNKYENTLHSKNCCRGQFVCMNKKSRSIPTFFYSLISRGSIQHHKIIFSMKHSYLLKYYGFPRQKEGLRSSTKMP